MSVEVNTLIPFFELTLTLPPKNDLYGDIIESASGTQIMSSKAKNGEGSAAADGIGRPRQLAALPNGDLIVGTLSNSVYIIPNAEASGRAGVPIVFATFNDDVKAQGVAYSKKAASIFVATTNHVFRIPYNSGDHVARTVTKLPISIRPMGDGTSKNAPAGDTDSHSTTSVAATENGKIYVSVGSSCNACAEVDPTRATIIEANYDGSATTTVARRIRNAVAMGVDPTNNDVWIGGAGQDCLPQGLAVCGAMDDNYETGRPYEYVDNLSLAIRNTKNVVKGQADYAWPNCEENGHAASYFRVYSQPGAPIAYPTADPKATAAPSDYCTNAKYQVQAQPLVYYLSYQTHIGMAVYPADQTGTYAFEKNGASEYAGTLIIADHGSWHENFAGQPVSYPQVTYVPLRGELPATMPQLLAHTNDYNPSAQWQPLIGGFEDAANRYGQPTGVAVGAQGSLFVADDLAGVIYRIRPGASDPNSTPARRRSTIRFTPPALPRLHR